METDHDLMRRLRDGDDAALAPLIGRYRQGAEAFADGILHDTALAQDVVQECFVRVYLLRREYAPTFRFQTYLYALVRNRCIDELRKRRRHAALLPRLATLARADADTPEAVYLHQAEALRLLDAVERLSPDERRLLLGFAQGGLSYAALAQELGVSLAQVKIRLHRIRGRLRRARDEG